MVKFQLAQDKCSLVDDYNEGDTVEVDFDLRGREWNGKYFTNLQAWRISRAGEGGGSGSSGSSDSSSSSQSAAPASNSTAAADPFDGEIPF